MVLKKLSLCPMTSNTMKRIFLESHHLKNRFFGFGQFNNHLIRAMSKIEQNEFKFIIHGTDTDQLRGEFGDQFEYKKYYSFRRYPLLRIRTKFDLWHSLNQNTKIEPKKDLPYLLTVHNTSHIKDPDNYSQEKDYIRFQQKLNRASAVTYISEFAKSSTNKFFNVPDVPQHVIYNGNPIREITIPDGYTPSVPLKKPFLFSIGEFTDRKNFQSLIPMLNHLSGFSLVIAGKNGTSVGSKIRSIIVDHGLEERIYLPGKISETEKQYYYQNCKAFVFPSLREGFGLPIIEAMRFGKPVFTSENTSLPEIGGELVFYWKHYESRYMAEQILEGLKKFRKREDWYRKNLILRARSFDWDESARKYFNVYKSLI